MRTAARLAPAGLSVAVVTPTLNDSRSGQLASGTAITVTVPSRQSGDYLTLIMSSNQAPTYTFGTGVASSTVLATAGSRLQVINVVTTGGPTTIPVTASISGVHTWWIGSWLNVDPAATVASAVNAIGNSTTSVVETPAVGLPYLASGHELYIRTAGVNSTATWTVTPTPTFATTANNAALVVQAGSPTAGDILIPATTSFDRGSAGSTRNESSLAVVLQPVQTAKPTLLTNGSFETAASGVATGWSQEFTAPRAATYSLSATGVVDGSFAQRMQFTGTTGDTGMVSLYQSPIAVNPGDVVHASIYVSGTLTNTYAIFGVEGFITAGGAYISEQDTTVTTPTGTPTKYDVQYTCPGNCTAVAVYFQVPGLVPTAVVDLYLDKATLVKV